MQVDLVQRLRILEDRVSELERLPEQVGEMAARVGALEVRVGALESQIVHFRREVAHEFSATRTQLADVRKALLERMDERWRHTLALHEDLVERIKRLRG